MAAALATAGTDGGVAEMARQLFAAIPAHQRLDQIELLRRRTQDELARATGRIAELRRARAEAKGGRAEAKGGRAEAKGGPGTRREADDAPTDALREHGDGGAAAPHRVPARASSFERRLNDARRAAVR